MKQEEIENLSVSSTVIDSSSTDQDLRIDCDKILELYQSTRSNLQSKLSKSELPRKNWTASLSLIRIETLEIVYKW